MQRLPQLPRPDWRARLDAQGFHFHSIAPDGSDVSATEPRFAYWREDVAYRFTAAQIDQIDDASVELHAMCMDLAARLIEGGELDRLQIPAAAQALVEQSWRRRDPHLYGRFDLAYSGDGPPKLLEYNADTPTSIIETAVAQWQWKVDVQPRSDQFNRLHEALVERLAQIGQRFDVPRLHLACQTDSLEDTGNVEYLLDVALQAGWYAQLLDIADIGVLDNGRYVDGDDQPISACFKLYPWEWLAAEPLAAHLGQAPTLWLEPAWKMLLSNKALLPLLWQSHPGHPNLLEAHFDAAAFEGRPFVHKPLLSREGSNIRLVDAQGRTTLSTDGDYGGQAGICQAWTAIAAFPAPETSFMHGPREAMHAVLGSWIVGDQSAGLCVREDLTPITSNSAYFVPHYFD
ncbi:MAG: glutathionylspermidine synthase family protein [Burkholderiaceae bacterium]|nr:glutathionylspermidine synthase family protein [Burkholderiaceae bacterium]